MTTKGAFKVSEICAILKECGKSGVVNFEYNGLKFDLRSKKIAPEEAQTTAPSVIIPPEVQVIADAQTRDAQVEYELNKKQDELDQLLIDDPEAYEEAVRRGDLVDEKRA
jgi:hypothetical protein